ncbi:MULTISPECIES: type IV pilus biogenesis/stability protein PilW [unclassified Tatumella]|uniref:type IV pilus biogenesis/stability protein PilW n=1 Tax=unclassified Tatumella TaxID=2649542 RepID=UPI002013165D|nr:MULTISPECIES: type IV pilus biogenesis/stability protein PilW [unclassified Tatumella]
MLTKSWMTTALLAVSVVVSGCSRPPSVSPVRLQLGLQYLVAGEYSAAERNLQRARLAAAEDYRPVLGLARLYQAQGDNDEAAVWYTRAEEIAPENGYVLNNYGAFLCSLRQYDKAQSRFLAAMQADETGSRIQALLFSGRCFLDAGDTRQAADSLSQAVVAENSAAGKLLEEAGRRLEQQKFADTRLLLEIYHQQRSASAESLWLKILYAARQNATSDVKRYGDQLARVYPLSIQYQRYLANEY